ncbi:hypothetical protein GCM10007425_07260 [Lysinibacillus alkalisoli]|uniref:Uncharacterized protein n=1 Tax=Lysinibacillus alkalisoli TaxID=1911548 RepID=A0A917FZX4_9BACI|nr:hypothetical protein [Lysinibacillus alkalisoli]GGG15522.1 hypothetical protein GCM10007425_07260 [Lysinibacillus alkalisoli]
MKKTIYIILTQTKTFLSRAIGMYTGKQMNHASIAFDDELHDMYSFGRLQLHNPLSGGFLREQAETGLFENARCMIYKVEVSTYQYLRMKEKVRYMHDNRDRYKYNFIGLFGVMFHKEVKRDRAYFCSQFVATILKMGGLEVRENPAFMTPHCLSNLEYAEPVYEGSLADYLHAVRLPVVPYAI